MGFWTAPKRASAAASTIASNRAGSIQETRVPAPTPRSASPAATRWLHSLNSPNVSVRSCSSIAIRLSGVSAARSTISCHSVLPDVSMMGSMSVISEGENAASHAARFQAVHSILPLLDRERLRDELVEQHLAAAVQVDDARDVAVRRDRPVAAPDDAPIDLRQAAIEAVELCGLATDA